MVTRSHVRTTRSNTCYAGHVSTIFPLPWSYKEAFNDLNWRNAMFDDWYKERLVANGSTQVEGVDLDETFSLVVKSCTIRTVLSLDISRHWPVHQFDVKNAFLHGDLDETVYMHQPLSFQDPEHMNYVCLLQRSLYGLKQAPRAWFQLFAAYITTVGYTPSCCDSSLFIYKQGNDTLFLLLYVDDIVLTASSNLMRDSSGMFLSQRKYATEILERAHMKYALELFEHEHMTDYNLTRPLADTKPKLGPKGNLVSYPTLDRSLIGTMDMGLQLYSSASTSLVAYYDVDCAGYPSTRRSTSGYFVFLGDNLLSWSSKHHHTLLQSSVEAEYRGVANVVVEAAFVVTYFGNYTHLCYL
nr:hypothetical protein [Tanacetum cinerariifolium]